MSKKTGIFAQNVSRTIQKREVVREVYKRTVATIVVYDGEASVRAHMKISGMNMSFTNKL